MALLDCICCFRHHLRTAVCWDSPDESRSRFLTYSCLVERANVVCRALRSSPNSVPKTDHTSSPDYEQQSPIAIYGRSCPEVVCAVLGVISLPAPYMPLDLGQPVVGRWSTLQTCNVHIALIELSLFSDFLSECNSQPSDCHIRFDSGLLQLGLVICHIQWPPLSQSHDDHVSKVDHVIVVEEFHVALKRYHQEINTDCWLCSHEDTTSPATKDDLKSTDLTNSDSTDSLCDSLMCSSANKEKPTSSDLTGTLSNSHTNQLPSLHPTSLSYLLHTTGTTGQPRPVKAPHCCVVPNIMDLRGRFAMSPDDVVFNAAPLTFDPSVVEIFLALSSGACLLIVPTKVKQSPHSLTKVLFQRQFVTVLQITPALVRQLPDSVIRSQLLGPDSHVRVLAFGGEACPSFNTLAQWKSPKNRTTIFNLYGITEVSSWATCYQVTADDLTGDSDFPSTVPLGTPLLGTRIQLRDEAGTPISRGSGFIWIGGLYRSCLVGDEHRLLSDVMRPSGDLGHIDKDGKLFYDGRRDRQVKRLGHRVNLDHIQQIVEGLEMVASCTVLSLAQQNLHGSDFQLVAFLVLTEVPISKSFLFIKMKEVLPNYCIPDHIEVMEKMPVNEHGKVDVRKLYQFYSQRESTCTCTSETNWTSLTIESAGALFKSCAQEVLGLARWSDQQNILELGISSFDVVRLANHLEDELKHFINPLSDKPFNMTKLVEYLLEQPLAQVAAYVCSAIDDKPKSDSKLRASSDGFKKEAYVSSSAQKRTHFGLSDHEELLPKKLRKMESEAIVVDTAKEIRSFRRGQSFTNGRLQCENCQSVSSAPNQLNLPVFELIQKWKVDTGKCVDASPLLVQDKSRDPSEIIYIGSHSGKFFAICFQTGRVLWETQLSDRIESSACLSVCGQFIIVGCYDGHVYSLMCDSGATHWCIQPGGSSEPIKSSPCIDPATGLVWIGSHDHHIYALNIYEKEVVYRIFPGGGSCFSSPCVDCDRRLLYCATLQGIIAAVNLDSGGILWTYKCPKPVFSSPTLLPTGNYVVVGCVDGGIYVLANNGQHAATLSTAGAIFSSCCVAQVRDSGMKIYCGSHDKHVYCWNEELKLEWISQEFDSEIYSIPCVSHVQFQTTQGTCQKPVLLTIISTTSGHIYILNPDSGLVLGKLALPWDVFSSPIIHDGCIALGCRDNYVYCYGTCLVSTELI